MPTGYTAGVANGTTKTFRDYAYSCARAFGAPAHMRDTPMGAPLPATIEPDRYYAQSMMEASAELDRLLTLSPMEAQRQCQTEHSAAMARWRERCDEIAMLRVRYRQMLHRSLDWKAPTEDHQSMRDFMIRQLSESMNNDCDWTPEMPRIKRWPDWLAEKISDQCKWHQLAVQSFRDESARTARRNEWLQDLIDSLPDA